MAFTTIDDPEANFQTVLYTGNGSTQSITLPGDTNMQPDLVWIKTRSNSSNHQVHNSLTSETYHYLRPNATTAEITSNSDALTAFNSDGFSLGSDGVINENTYTYAAWCWKGGTTSGITTDGNTTITPSSYSFNADAGFALLKYSGNGTAGAKVAHGLGKVPKFIVTKRQDEGAESWTTFHAGIGSTKFVNFNSTSAAGTATNRWNDTDPDTVNFTLGSEGSVNASSQPLYAWCFADVQGYSKFGSYTGNGNADGTFVYTGFRPAWVLCKKSSSTGNWNITDTKRNTGNPHGKQIEINSDGAEFDNERLDILSNGFKHRASGSDLNGSATSYIYVAFAEAPFVNSNGVPCNAR